MDFSVFGWTLLVAVAMGVYEYRPGGTHASRLLASQFRNPLPVLRENVVRFEPFSNQQHSKVESEAFLDRDQDVTMLHRCRKCPIEFLVGTIGSGTKKSNADFAMTYERTTARY